MRKLEVTLTENNLTGTKEWAPNVVNVQTGCPNSCLYCYARAMIVGQYGNVTPEEWAKPTPRPLTKFKKYEGRLMFPSSHDITPDNLDLACETLKGLLAAGNRIVIVTKPWLECVKRLCRELAPYREQVLFRFTLGSMDEIVLRFWEPGASSAAQRLTCIGWALGSLFQTSVSIEPMLDEYPEKVVHAVYPFVTETIWLGKANRLMSRLKLNGADEEHMAAGRRLLEFWTDERVQHLYEALRYTPKIRWKDSIRKVLGIPSVDEVASA